MLCYTWMIYVYYSIEHFFCINNVMIIINLYGAMCIDSEAPKIQKIIVQQVNSLFALA